MSNKQTCLLYSANDTTAWQCSVSCCTAVSICRN